MHLLLFKIENGEPDNMQYSLKKLKLYFTASVIGLILLIVGGGYFFDSVILLTRGDFNRFGRFISYNIKASLSLSNLANVNLAKDEILNDSAMSDSHLNKAYSIPVLLYHGITKTPDRFNLTEETFFDHLSTLEEAGYRTISLGDFTAFIDGEIDLPPKSYLLTFDDGRFDSFNGANPVLKSLKLNAIMFATANNSISNSKSGFYLNSDEIRKMIKSGLWEIGSHAFQKSGGQIRIDQDDVYANFLSNKMWLIEKDRLESDEEYFNRIRIEIEESKKTLEDRFGITVKAFSYPYGDYGYQTRNNPKASSTISELVSTNYDLAFEQVWPNDNQFSFNYRFDDRKHIRRIEADPSWSGDELIEYMKKGEAKVLPYEAISTRYAGWKRGWGKMSLNENSISLESDINTNGAMAFLDGSKSWDNYELKSSVYIESGSHIILIARFMDDKNYTACTFGHDRVKIENFVNGNVSIRNESFNKDNFVNGTSSVSVYVKDNFASCSINNKVVTFATIDNGLGGVGFKIWDEIVNNSAAIFNNVVVSNTD